VLASNDMEELKELAESFSAQMFIENAAEKSTNL
jgi:hypothetical protein